MSWTGRVAISGRPRDDEAEGAEGAGVGTAPIGTCDADAKDGIGGKNPGANCEEPRYSGRDVVDAAMWLVVLAARIAASWGGMKGGREGSGRG